MGRAIKLVLYYFAYQLAFTFLVGLPAGIIKVMNEISENDNLAYAVGKNTASMTGLVMVLAGIAMIWHLIYFKYVQFNKTSWTEVPAKTILLSIPFIIAAMFICNVASEFIELPNLVEDTFIGMSRNVFGIIAIAANSFAITAESLCYMPGYGISEAATTLVGQSLGANRIRLLRRFANITVWSGMLIMGVMGALMYMAAPQIIGVMTPVEEIRTLGIEILRIEAFAEPMFAASIVAYGVFVGVGGTFMPSLMNFGSIWGVRLTLAARFAPTMGLPGVWLAMCIELCFRGTIFLVRL